MVLNREVLEVEISGIKANLIQWKRSTDINKIVLKALEKELDKLPKLTKL